MDPWDANWADYYEELGVSPSASDRVIKAAYRAMAQDFHPDHDPANTERMKRINIAYEVLGAIESRHRYDTVLRERKEAAGRRAEAAKQAGSTTPPPPPGSSQSHWTQSQAPFSQQQSQHRHEQARPSAGSGSGQTTRERAAGPGVAKEQNTSPRSSSATVIGVVITLAICIVALSWVAGLRSNKDSEDSPIVGTATTSSAGPVSFVPSPTAYVQTAAEKLGLRIGTYLVNQQFIYPSDNLLQSVCVMCSDPVHGTWTLVRLEVSATDFTAYVTFRSTDSRDIEADCDSDPATSLTKIVYSDGTTDRAINSQCTENPDYTETISPGESSPSWDTFPLPKDTNQLFAITWGKWGEFTNLRFSELQYTP